MAEQLLALDDGAARERVARVETLLEALEGAGASVPRDSALELVQALLDLYGEGLRRLVSVVAQRDDGEVAAALADDELVTHLLLLHGLHPVPLEARVRGALAEVRPYLESHGGDVQLLGVDDGVVRLAMEGSCSGCPSSTVTLKLAIEDAIYKAAPDVDRIEADGAVAPAAPAAPAPAAGLLQIELSDALRAPAPGPAPGPDGEWATADGLPALAEGGSRLYAVAGQPVLFLAAAGRTYAYRPDCPGCGASLEGAPLAGDELRCPACGGRYDVRRAGRGVDEPGLHLAPVPLLVDGGVVRVALGAPG
jgi:Fe-S cluster biogenesis protein NfuA/nitrite reductase/ring-hydroxylating ferredoxin subunit